MTALFSRSACYSNSSHCSPILTMVDYFKFFWSLKTLYFQNPYHCDVYCENTSVCFFPWLNPLYPRNYGIKWINSVIGMFSSHFTITYAFQKSFALKWLYNSMAQKILIAHQLSENCMNKIKFKTLQYKWFCNKLVYNEYYTKLILVIILKTVGGIVVCS